MRPLLTTEEIKKVLKLAFNDDILSWEETYKTFIQIQKESLDISLVQDLNHEEKFKEIAEKFNLKDKDEERIRIFLLVLSLVSEAGAIKKLVQKIVNGFNAD